MNAVLEASSVNKAFGAVVAAADVNIVIAPDEVVGVIGANGAGKTTFINMVTGYLVPDSGSIRYRGQEITGRTPRTITRLGMHRSFQIPQIFGELSVFDNMLVAQGIARRSRPGFWRPLRTAAALDDASGVIDRFGLSDVRNQPAKELPQGQRKLLDIAMAMVGNPSMILMDEPTSGISVDEKLAVMDRIMAALALANVTVLFVEHDMEIVGRYAKRVIAFYDGTIISDGPPGDVLSNDDVRTYVIGPELHAGQSRDGRTDA